MRLVFRTAAQQSVPDDAILLDRLRGRAATVHSGGNLLEGLRPPGAALDVLNLGEAVYAADRVVPRPGDWSPRELELTVPVSDPDRLRAAAPTVERLLNFLTGDRWAISPADRPTQHFRPETPARQIDAVCLLSGGLDSLAGAIDMLADGLRAELVSHYEPSRLDHSRQQELAQRLTERFGRPYVKHRQRALAPVTAVHPAQARSLSGETENTTRSRSLLFIANGVAVAAAYGGQVPLLMPENGFVGINVPLTRSRLGPLSTRTTHPHVMVLIADALAAMGVTNSVVNPYRLMTKGEALAASAEPDLLAALGPVSLSCAHPEQGRFQYGTTGNCGHCWPCLIRRAAMHAVGLDDGDQYACDVLTDPDLLDRDGGGAHLRALLMSLARPARPEDVLVNGPVPRDEIAAFADLHRRGRAELAGWLAGGHEQLARRVGVRSTA